MKGRTRVGLVMALLMVFAMMVAAFPGAAVADINVPPVAQAGPDQAVHQGYTYDGSDVTLGAFPLVTLDGTGSYDMNLGDTLTYSWSGDATLTGANTVNPTFTPAAPGTYDFTLTVTDGVSGDTDGVRVYAGTTWFVRIGGLNGSSDGYDGFPYTRNPVDLVHPNNGPFRTITHAIGAASTGDRILVGPANHYGGNDAATAEQITVDKSYLTLQSLEGRANTLIDVSEQSGELFVEQVVEIIKPHVTLGSDLPVIDPYVGHGFTLTGAARGIYVHEEEGPHKPNPDHVHIHMNKVLLEDCTCRWDIGIKVIDSKMPVIDDNIVDISCTDDGVGIVVVNAEAGPAYPSHGLEPPQTVGAQVTNNTVTVDAEDTGEGIVLINSPVALVDNNSVTVLVGPSYGLGIGLYAGSDLSDVTNNTVTVTVDGGVWAVGIGVEVKDSQRVTVGGTELVQTLGPGDPGSLGNTVNVTTDVHSGEFGGQLAIGIHLSNAPGANVDDNYVNVLGGGVASLSDSVDARGVGSLDDEELADLQVVADHLGISISLSGGLVVGILAWRSDWIDVVSNEVIATANMTVNVTDRHLSVGEAAALSFGIKVICSDEADVTDNDVTADAYTYLDVSASDPSIFPFPTSSGGGLAAAGGIVAALSANPEILRNEVYAHGDVLGYVVSRAGPGVTEEADTIIAKLDSDVLSVVYDIVTDSVESDEVGAQIVGDPQAAIVSIAEGGALGFGVGIWTLLSNGARINYNSPVTALGTVDLTVWAIEWSLGGIAYASGGGLGLGVAILDQSCSPTEVMLNNVDGSAYARVDAQAAEFGGFITAAFAESCAASIGLGIVLIGALSPLEADEVEESAAPPSMTSVIGNFVAADGYAKVIGAAYDRALLGDAFADGNALGFGGGIVVVGHMAPVIVANQVGVGLPILGEANADVYAAAISCVDPWAWGVSHGIGIGIMAVYSPFAYITDNTAIAVGDAYGEVTSIEEMVMVDIIAYADGSSIGFGAGIVVAMSNYTSVGPNMPTGQLGQGTGNAEVKVVAVQHEPLDEAFAGALGIGIGKGIVVACLDKAWVIHSNTFIGNGHAIVDVTALGDWATPAGMGLALGIDEFVTNVDYARFNYNDMPVLDASTGSWPVTVMDLGMLAVGAGHVDARYQWWAAMSGPSGEGPGSGQPLVSAYVCFVQFVPWLWAEHDWSLEHHIGKFGKYIELDWSWNTLSTPITLTADYDEWSEILELSNVTGGISAPMRYDTLTGLWVVATQLVPLEGYHVIVDAPTTLILLASVENSMPTRALEEGWNLIGPNPPFCWECIDVGDAITPVAHADGGEGFSHVISNSPTQPNWYYTLRQWRNGDEGPCMWTGRAYWVWMNSAETLAGLGHTPVGLYPNQ